MLQVCVCVHQAGGMTPERFEELERQNDFLSQQLVLLTAEKNKLKSEFVRRPCHAVVVPVGGWSCVELKMWIVGL
jgi:hypothetical protein